MPNLTNTRGITLVEVLAATLVTGMLAVALTSAAHVILESDQEAQRAWQASELGIALLEEVAALPFDDPQTPWGPKKGVRLKFRIIKGPYAGQTISYKGQFFQDKDSGRWFIGSKSNLAKAIRVITGGEDTLNKGHEGMPVYVIVKVKILGPKSKTPGKEWSDVTDVVGYPDDEKATAREIYKQLQAQRASNSFQPQAQQTMNTAQPPAQPAPAAAQPVPAPAPATSAPAPAAQATTQKQGSSELLDDLTDLSDF